MDISIPIDKQRRLPGVFSASDSPLGIIIFAHGSGSSRYSPRNQAVAEHLNRNALATLLFDLLTEEESEDRSNVFDIALLGKRLLAAIGWIRHFRQAKALPIGLFGASTGAAAALYAAAEAPSVIKAVVSRGGRPDLAWDKLRDVQSPTLLIVGGFDEEVLELNRMAAQRLAKVKLVEIPGATHLFEEPGALEQVAQHASDWFTHYLRNTEKHVA
jgi:putative phosphoribosyl transferase